jgi:hypothetical protein
MGTDPDQECEGDFQQLFCLGSRKSFAVIVAAFTVGKE